MQYTRLFLLTGGALLTGMGLLHCDDSSSSPGPDPSFDSGSFDAANPSKDTGVGPSPEEDSSSPEVDASDAAVDVSDAGADAEVDADVDAGPTPPSYDDAGCRDEPLVLPSAAAEGLPATGLKAWLRADLGARTREDGTTLCAWSDLSGNGNDFLPSANGTSSVGPSTLKGKAGVSFTDGRGVYISSVLGIPSTSGRTVALFAQRTGSVGTRSSLFTQGISPTNQVTHIILENNTWVTAGGNKEGVYMTNSSFDTDVVATTDPRSFVFSISDFTAGKKILGDPQAVPPVPPLVSYWIDGNKATLTTRSGGEVGPFDKANVTGFGYQGSGSGKIIGEGLIWDRALTTEEAQKVIAYFAKRYP